MSDLQWGVTRVTFRRRWNFLFISHADFFPTWLKGATRLTGKIWWVPNLKAQTEEYLRSAKHTWQKLHKIEEI